MLLVVYFELSPGTAVGSGKNEIKNLKYPRHYQRISHIKFDTRGAFPLFPLFRKGFLVLLALRLPCLGKRDLVLVLFVCLSNLHLFGLSVVSSSWCLERAVNCDCGTPWSFLLTCFCLQ